MQGPASNKKRIIFWVIIVLVVFPFFLRGFLFEPFNVPSSVQDDTVRSGDYFLVNKFIYGIHVPFTDLRILPLAAPKRGDVVVFQAPIDDGKVFVKRVIGLPGDEIRIVDKQVYINGALYKSTGEVHREPDIIPANQNPRDNMEPVKVPEHAYFVMGDNRDRSYDSRFWGFLRDRNIRGRASIICWSWDDKNRKIRWDRFGQHIR